MPPCNQLAECLDLPAHSRPVTERRVVTTFRAKPLRKQGRRCNSRRLRTMLIGQPIRALKPRRNLTTNSRVDGGGSLEIRSDVIARGTRQRDTPLHGARNLVNRTVVPPTIVFAPIVAAVPPAGVVQEHVKNKPRRILARWETWAILNFERGHMDY